MYGGKYFKCYLSKETKIKDLLHVILEQLSIYCGYGQERESRVILPKWESVRFTVVVKVRGRGSGRKEKSREKAGGCPVRCL